MKFVITRTSNSNYKEVKEISTLEELINFKNEVGEIIITHNSWYNEGREEVIEILKEWYDNVNWKEVMTIPYEIEIYDDYRE